MPWTNNDLDKICEALGWPVTFPYYREQIQQSMDAIAALPNPEVTIARVQGYLEQYSVITNAKQAVVTSNSAGLIRQKTDGLEDEWESSHAVLKRFNSELDFVRTNLAKALGLYHLFLSQSGTGVRIGRAIANRNPYPSFRRYVR